MILSHQDTNQIEKFFSKYKPIRFKRNSIIIKPDDTFESIYYIKSGFVKQVSTSKTGEEFIVTIYRPGSFFAISLALHRKVSAYTFEAMSEVVVIKAPVQEIIALLDTQPTLARELLSRITSGLNSLVARMETLVFGSARQKVAAVLLQNAQRFGKKVANTIELELPLTHQQLASLTGLTRETVSIEMAKLKKDKILTYRGKTITIFTISTLRSLAPSGT
jgi:CRP-like cAMP-binding protein